MFQFLNQRPKKTEKEVFLIYFYIPTLLKFTLYKRKNLQRIKLRNHFTGQETMALENRKFFVLSPFLDYYF